MSASPEPAKPHTPRPSASLVLLRQGEGRLEVLVGRRALHVRAFPGATAFPGGKLDPQDAAWPGAEGDVARTSAFAALRETFEETGLLVCEGGEGPPASMDVASARAEVEAGRWSFQALLQHWDRRLDLTRLTPFAHWITPQAAPYRFDTLFFLAEASAYEAEAELICAEFETLAWVSPATILQDAGQRLMTPTRHCLHVLAACADVAEAVIGARTRGLIDGEAVRAAARA